MKKRILLSILTLCCSIVHADPLIIRFSHVNESLSPKGLGADKFKELAEKYTGGRVRVDVYPKGTFLNERDELKALRDGKVEFIVPPVSKLNELYTNPDENPYTVMDFPFVVEATKDLQRLEKAGIFKKMASTLSKTEVLPLAIWDNGFKMLSSNMPIEKFEDFAKLNIRINPAPILRQQVADWGANPRPTAANEMATATYYNVVDSTENTASSFWNSKLNTSQKYVYETKHGYSGSSVVVNRKYWNELPADVRTQLEKALSEATTFQIEASDRDNQFALQEVRVSGSTRVKTPSPDVLAKMKSAAQKTENSLSPTQKQYLKDIKSTLGRN